jgi:hypothetical protein
MQPPFHCRLEVRSQILRGAPSWLALRWLGVFLLGSAGEFSAGAAAAEGEVRFNRDIRPIMSDTCFLCHGPDAKARKANLRLDLREETLKPAKSGAVPIIPGKPEESEVYKRLVTADTDDLMPPPESHKVLSPGQRELFRRWIAQGAAYEAHWAYTPVQRPMVPSVRATGWVQTPVDAFVLAALEAGGVQPAPAADRRRWLRRLSLDLIGLPPTPGEVRAFAEDTRPEAWERQIDRLLRSPHFGERWAVWWFDVARFTDTVGYHGDQNQRIFPYRDYVIDAFNRNKPFDVFTLEQLAGDLLPSPTTEQLVATGFNRLNMMTREGGAQPREYLAKYGADRVRTVGATWLGSTLGCAECHDHKYDPYSTRDFYALQAFFADIKQWGVYQDYDYTPNPELKGWSNDHPFPPELEVSSAHLAGRHRQAELKLEDHLFQTAVRLRLSSDQSAAFRTWIEGSRGFVRQHPDGWQTPQVEADYAKDGKPLQDTTNATVAADGSVQFRRRLERGEEHQLELRPDPGWLAALRLEILPQPAPGALASDGAGQRPTLRPSLVLRRLDGTEQKLTVGFGEADFKAPRYANTYEILGVGDGWKLSPRHAGVRQQAVWLIDPPVEIASGEVLRIKLGSDPQAPSRLSLSPFAALHPLDSAGTALARAVQAPERARKAADFQRLADAYLVVRRWDSEAYQTARRLYRAWLECEDGKTSTMITQAMEPLPIRVLPRGNWLDESGALVAPAGPHFLPPVGGAREGRRTRLDLARWLCSPANPLTSRVVVNRLWKQFFGNGLSASVDDLGAQGEPPSHPELLDWLAAEFRDSGWNFQHLVRLIVTSASYRQDSNLRPELKEVDPNNRRLAAQNPRRLDAEFVRDNALAIAGLANFSMGGPSFKPYQPANYYENLQFPDRVYRADLDERQYRRGVYMHWQRTFLHPMLANFDAPAREECTASRVVSNTPQQALTLLNDPTFVEAARALGQRLLLDPGLSDSARIARAFELVLARAPEPAETDSLLRFLGDQRAYYRLAPAEAGRFTGVGLQPPSGALDQVELAAWAGVGRVLLNMHETVTRY